MNRFLEHIIIDLQWFILTAVAFPLGLLAGSAILVLADLDPSTEVFLLVLGILTGVLVAIAQALVLNRQSPASVPWIALTALGTGAGLWVLSQVTKGASGWSSSLFAGMLGGLVPGLLQLGLVSSPAWKRGEWLLLNVIGWGVAHMTGALFVAGGMFQTLLPALGVTQTVAMIGWAISGLLAVLLLLFFTPIARRRELSGRITWLP